MGVQQAFGGASRVVGPLWATWVFQYVGPPYPFLVASTIMLVVLLLALQVPVAARAEDRQPLAAD
jgi:MFS family permease